MDRSSTKPPTACDCCGSRSDWFGCVDFTKSCEDYKRKVFPDSGTPVDYYRCTSCGFLFTPFIHDWPAEKVKREIYNDDYVLVDPEFVDLRPTANASLVSNLFGKRSLDISILDYGGGDGTLVHHLRASGHRQARSYDPFYDPDDARPTEPFDVVLAFEVIEHVPDSFGFFATLSSLVKSPGFIIFSTLLQPKNIATEGVDWWYLAPRNGHVSLHTFDSLKTVTHANDLGFGSINQTTHFAYKTVPDFAAHLLAS